MDIALIALSLIGLFCFPVAAYAVIWFTSRERTRDRPEPPEPNHNRRTVPGRGSDQ